MVKVWENDRVNSELNLTRVGILESVQKIAIVLLYKLHPTEKSSKSASLVGILGMHFNSLFLLSSVDLISIYTSHFATHGKKVFS